MIVDSIENGSYVRRMIATPGEPDLPVPESFHEQTDEELTENDIKKMDANDQAIKIILLGLPEDIYAAVDSYETAKEIWERVRQIMKGSDIGEQEKKAKLFNEWENFTSTDWESEKKAKLFNEWESSLQNAGVPSGGNQNGLVVVPGIPNQNGTGNVVAARAEGSRNGNQSRIQLQAEEFDFMAAAGDLDEIKEVNANCILMANLQHASTSEDDDDEDPEEDPVDYLADGGDDGDDEEGSSEDDEDDDMDIEADEEEEEEEHPAPVDYVVVASTAADQAPFVEETEPFETDESQPHHRHTLHISSSAAAARPAGERKVGYGITDSWDEIVETLQGAP
nr:hypothetical protein [Tanacetum cinerariifolium]